MSQGTVSYEAAAVLGPGEVGGKGWNLGRLQRYGFRVPRGGVLRAEVYRQFLGKLDIQSVLDELADVRAEAVTSEKVEAILNHLRTMIETTPFPEEIAEAVQAFLIEDDLANLALAVRSSATAEDSASCSFAGIHESFLHVPGTVQEVLQAIKACYASLWTARALAYRRHYGLADSEVDCAVVICAMVTGSDQQPPPAAGVAFSCDPHTGQRNRITINAAAGWGEQVVRGSISPEVITVVPSPANQTLLIERSQHSPQVLCDKRVRDLALLVQRVQWALGDGQEPQDVEWVDDGDFLWLVQARPVTYLTHSTIPELINVPTVWSNGNVRDVIPGILTPLSWSILQPIVSTLLRAPCQAAGYILPDEIGMMQRFKGRAYLNLTVLQWSYYDALGILPSEVNQGLGGHQPEITVPTQHPLRGKSGFRRLRGRLALLRAIGRNARTLPRTMQRLQKQARDRSCQQLIDLTDAEILVRFQLLHQQANVFGLRFQFANMGGVWGDYLIQALERAQPGKGRALASALMAATHSVVSAEHAYQLYEIAGVARNDVAALAYLESRPRDPQGWCMLPIDSPFRQAFLSFLESFGHRSIYEFELANQRWGEDPSYLLDCIQDLLAQDGFSIPYVQARERRHAAEAEVAHLPLRQRLLVSWLANQFRRTASHREAGKSTLVAMLQPLRNLAREIGRRMLKEHILEDREDVFFLGLPEIATFLRKEWDGRGAKALVADRKKQQSLWSDEEPVDIFVARPEGHSEAISESRRFVVAPEAEKGVHINNQSQILQGLGASPGCVSGRARLIAHPHEGQRLQAGEVLVAPSTDPAWTPLFLRASAIVMETGGYLSHGAIVAREFGIPAVINVPGLLKVVEDGQYLTVDGNQGRVLLEISDEEPV